MANIEIEKWLRKEERWIVMNQDWMEKKAKVQIYIFQLTKKLYIYIYIQKTNFIYDFHFYIF